MAKCEICGKDVSFGIKVSHSHRRSNRTWKPNIRRVKALVNGTPKRVYACTRCLRSGKVTRAVYKNWSIKLWTSFRCPFFYFPYLLFHPAVKNFVWVIPSSIV